jgi:hypothetical protein
VYRYLWTQNETVYYIKSMDETMEDAAPKLRARELRLSGRKRNRLKGEKAI